MRNNTATFCPVGNSCYSMLAPVVIVELNHQPVSWLEPLEIIRTSTSSLNQARFCITPPSGDMNGNVSTTNSNSGTDNGVPYNNYPQVHIDPSGRLEDMAAVLQAGQQVAVKLIGSSDINRQLRVWPLFSGLISTGTGSLSGTDEHIEISAKTRLTYYNTAVIDGLRTMTADNGITYTKASAIIFNPGGIGNRYDQQYQYNGRSYYVFTDQPVQGCRWDYADAIHYLLAEYFADEGITPATLESIRILTDGMYPEDINITGLQPLEAVERLCQQAGLYYCLEHIITSDGQLKDMLRFYNRTTGRYVTLRHQKAGSRLDTTQTNLLNCKLNSTARTIPESVVQQTEIPWLRSDIYPGDRVKGIAGKGPDLQILNDTKPQNWQTELTQLQIEQVKIKLADKWTTEIIYG